MREQCNIFHFKADGVSYATCSAEGTNWLPNRCAPYCHSVGVSNLACWAWRKLVLISQDFLALRQKKKLEDTLGEMK